MKIKDIPIKERPREKLIDNGANNLSNEDLLSIILKTGTKDKSVKELSLELLSNIQDIDKLKDISYNELIKIKGIGKAKAIELLASIELGKRIFINNKSKVNKKLKSAQDIYNEVKYLFYGKKQEHFYCLYLNNKKQLIENKLLFVGTINKSVVHPREIFKNAYITSASSIICLHNHPSNDIEPSKEDIELTNKLIDIGKINGIPIIDHIIITDDNYYSFYENNPNLFIR